jgi:YebC/PmpR family DNA-binding regulatory protein
MSGHNKWSTIKHKKGKADAARGKLFTKIIKEITVAARAGGGNEDSNPRLRTAILAAKAANMPSDNVSRAIKKGTGELEGVAYEEITYEGYGPEGVAIIVACVTDNKNRCVSEVRHTFTRYNCKLAEIGSVSWIFKDAAKVSVDAAGASEDALMEATLDAGVDDIENQGDAFVLYCPYAAMEAVKAAAEKAGFKVTESGPTKIPSNTVKVEGKSAESVLKLLDALDELDDVQNVWANFEMDDAEFAKLSA